MAISLHFDAIDHVKALLWRFPRTSLVAGIVLLILLSTRVFTTVRFHRQLSKMNKATHPIAPPEAPYVIPYLGNGIMFLNLPKSLKRLIRSNPNTPCFTLNIAGSKHHVVASPSITHQMSVSRTIIPKLDLWLFIERVMEYFWADGGAIRNMDRVVAEDIHKALNHMMHSSFISGTTPALSASLSTQTADLVTFSSSIVDQYAWERSSRVTTTSPTTATTNLFDLVRFFISTLSATVFFSPDFVTNYPSLSEDIFLSDSKFELLVAGIPQWLPFMLPAARARDRVVEAVRQHHLAYWKHYNGEDPGAMWSNVSSTCKPIVDRLVALGRAGDFSPDLPEHKRGYVAAVSNAAILWALQVNAPSVAFWMIYYIYSNPTVLAQIREEISPFVRTEPSAFANKGGGITEKPRLQIDANGLRSSAKLLLGSLHEVLRLEAMGMTYKRVTDDITVNESPEDAAIYGRPGDPKTFVMKRGEFVCIPHTVHHRDSRYFPDPDKFDPRRFWTLSSAAADADADTNATHTNQQSHGSRDDDDDDDAEVTNKKSPLGSSTKATTNTSATTKPLSPPPPSTTTTTTTTTAPSPDKLTWPPSRVDISHLTTHPFGGGTQMCKGKKFAETEILLVVACIIHLWEFRPVERTVLGGETVVQRESASASGAEPAGHRDDNGDGGGGGATRVQRTTNRYWKDPGRVSNNTTAWPAREVRVEVSRREN